MENENLNNDSQKLLIAIYKNIRIATQSIENILSSIKLNDITVELSKELSQYYVFEKEAVMLAQSLDFNLKDNSFIQKTQVWISVKFNLLSSSCPQHIAEMMLVGTMMGIIDLVKAAANHDGASEEIVNLAQSVENFERENVETLFEYLKMKPNKNNQQSNSDDTDGNELQECDEDVEDGEVREPDNSKNAPNEE